MSKAEPRILWEYTWNEEYDDYGPDTQNSFTFVFRVVGHFEDGQLGWVTQESLSEDAMGTPIWLRHEDRPMPERACAELLRLAGLLPADIDLSEVTG